MAPKSNRSENISPDALNVAGGGGASADRTYDILQRLSSIEKSIAYLEGATDDTKKEVKEISDKISLAQGSFTTAKYFLGAIFVAIWGILAMWAKHHFGW